MAPLLGRKPFPLVKPLPGEEPLFTIPHTQEAFRTREYPLPAAPAGRMPASHVGPGREDGPGAAGPGQLSAPPGRVRAERLHPHPAPHFVPGLGDGERACLLPIWPQAPSAGEKAGFPFTGCPPF